MSMTYPHLNGNAYLNKDEICFKYSEKSQIIQKTLKNAQQKRYAKPP